MKNRLFVIFSFVLISGCYKETLKKAKKVHGVNWTGTYAVPAANIDIGLNDALTFATSKNPVGVVENNVIFLAYEETLFSSTGEQLLILGNHNHSFSDQLTGGEQSTLTGSGTVKVQRNFSGTYVHSDEIDSVSYKGGQLNVSINNSYSHAAVAVITFTDLTKSGQTVKVNVNVAAKSNANVNVDLAGCRLRLTNGGSGYNHFRCNLEMNYTNSGSGFTGTDAFDMNVGFNNQKFARVWGYFGNATFIQATDSVDIGIFDQGPKIKSSNVLFNDPRLKVFLKSSFGIPFKVNTANVQARKNGVLQGNVSGFPEDQNIIAATAGGTVLDSTVKNSGNSNIKTIINNQPRFITFDVKADANPAGKIQRNYIDFDSRLSIKVWVELPFNGWAGSIEAKDTTPLKMDLGGADDYIDWISFRIETTNDLPLDVQFQGFFADSSGKILDSVFIPARPFAKAAVVDANGDVIQSTHDVYNITFEKARIKNIVTATQLILNATLRSAEFNGSTVGVRLTTSQRFKLKLGVHTKLTANEKF